MRRPRVVFVGHRFTDAAVVRDPVLGLVGGLLLVDVLTAVVILGVISSPRGLLARLLSLRPLVWIGTISYGLYLWNFPVERVLFGERGHLPVNPAQVAIIAVALTIAIAASPTTSWSARCSVSPAAPARRVSATKSLSATRRFIVSPSMSPGQLSSRSGFWEH